MPNLVSISGFFIVMFFVICCSMPKEPKNFFLAAEDYQKEGEAEEEILVDEPNECTEYARIDSELKDG